MDGALFGNFEQLRSLLRSQRSQEIEFALNAIENTRFPFTCLTVLGVNLRMPQTYDDTFKWPILPPGVYPHPATISSGKPVPLPRTATLGFGISEGSVIFSDSFMRRSAVTAKIQRNLLRRLSHCLDQLVAPRNVIELRLEKQRLGIKFLSESAVRLRLQGRTLLKLLRGSWFPRAMQPTLAVPAPFLWYARVYCKQPAAEARLLL
jgi:hypothetical protein